MAEPLNQCSTRSAHATPHSLANRILLAACALSAAAAWRIMGGKLDDAYAQGIAIHVQKPQLVAAPAVHDMCFRILSGGLFTDEKRRHQAKPTA